MAQVHSMNWMNSERNTPMETNNTDLKIVQLC